MQKENKRKVIILVIGIIALLLACIGATYAYFTARVSGVGNKTVDMKAVVLASANMDYGDKIEANGIYPGNKIIKTLHVTGSGPADAKPITATIILTPNVIDFPNHVKYTVYEVEKSEINTNDICESSKPTVEAGKYYDAMECDTTNLGDPILEGIFEGRKTITKEIEVTSTTDTTYYLLVEYINDPNSQNEEQGKTFTINLGFQATYTGPSMHYIFKLDDEEVANIPEKESDYEVEVACDDGVKRVWNKEQWKLEVESKLEYDTTCTISFKKDPIAAGIEAGELSYDETEDNNLRYIGANPNNYVYFNGELWRIIGWMNNTLDSDGVKATRMKIIRSSSLGSKKWHSTRNSNWSTSSLQVYLNGTYYNSLTNDAKSMIESVIWNLGGRGDFLATASQFYIDERGESVYGSNPKTWIGNIGLTYPSDYGFSAADKTCLNKTLYSYYNNEKSCNNQNWLRLDNRWTIITPSTYGGYAFCIDCSGQWGGYVDGVTRAIFPTVFLNINVKIASGSGTKTDPFILGT